MRLKFNLKFYDPGVIKKASSIFEEQDLGSFQVDKGRKYAEVSINQLDEGIKKDELVGQFYNYVLSETLNYKKGN